MRVVLAVAATALSLIAAPALAQQGGDKMSRYLIDEQFTLPEASGSDIEKLRTARYGVREPDDDYFEPAVDEMRVRWKLNRVKMRIPFSTSRLQ